MNNKIRSLPCLILLLLIPLACQGLCGTKEQLPSQNEESIPILDDVEQRMQKQGIISPPSNIFPGPPTKAVTAPIECGEDYDCSCQMPYIYSLMPVNRPDYTKIKFRLDNIDKSPMFGCYEIEGGWMERRIENRCRFIRSIRIEKSKSSDSAIRLSYNLEPKLKEEDIKEIWIECGIRVDSEGVPVDNALPFVKPLFLATDKQCYLVKEKYQDKGISCLLIPHYSGKVFDVRRCTNKKRCYDKAITIYFDKIQDAFSSFPLSATKVMDSLIPPNELWMRRKYQVSN